jgi:plasmid stabilization system protein ParE
MPLAEQDLEAVHEYVWQDNPRAAAKLVTRIFEAVEMLSRYPLAGRMGRVPSTREFRIANTPFIVVYHASRTEVQILAVIHSARRWPPYFDDRQ